MFETRAQGPKSEVVPIIWAAWDDFAKRASDAETAAGVLAGTITVETDLGHARDAGLRGDVVSW
ncbi:hypothetical protein [Sagittula stellata]|uniref:Uncharacterized protein n=1 Tax=Sagittula stellata (strain ATCC 700073 / DSM 11524 / E-37) TaxID=388399 RepID=A3K6S7_SAGS3|nr:hypothetical protein [Sagittula stellata]EBA07054.1 hypothetical protein SSE37_12691 [Sagittula stellata E-37]